MDKLQKTKNEMLNLTMTWLQNAHHYTELSQSTIEANDCMKELGIDPAECKELNDTILSNYLATMHQKMHELVQEIIQVIDKNGTTAEDVEKSCQEAQVSRTSTGEWLN